MGELKLLGLSYDGELDTLTAKTRGRMGTPSDPEGRKPTHYLLETKFSLLNNIVGRVKSKYPMLVELCESLLRVKDINTYFQTLNKEFNTVVALMYQGGEHGP